ncbi:MAG: efflux RND transporter periplasmic adaptor subunit [Isosphaeraceae bacterium]
MNNRWRHAGILLPAIFIGCGSRAETVEPTSGNDEAHVSVRVVAARRGTMTVTIDGLGRCEALPDQLATLTPAVEGHVHELLVKQGETVSKGQPIVELDKAVAQADLAEKTGTRDGLKASLALLKSIPRPEERKANELAIDQAKVAVAQAKATLDRLQPLLTRHEVSGQQVFLAGQTLEQARIQQQTAEATLHVMMIGPRPEAIAEADGKIKTADGLVALSQTHLDFHTIRAPINGVLEALTCHPGQTIAIGTPIGEVVNNRQVFATVWMPPRSALAVRPGQAARVQSAEPRILDRGTEPDPKEQGYAGRVAFKGRVADPQTGNLPVRVLVDNLDDQLALGQSVKVAITVEETKDVLQVPTAAIFDLGEGPVLNTVRDGKTVSLHPEVGPARDGWIAVSGTDLKAGEPVIIEGGYNLPEETPVKLANDKFVARAEPH